MTFSVKHSPRILWSINDRKRRKGLLKDVCFPHLTPSLLSKLCYTQKTFSYNKVEMPGNVGECYGATGPYFKSFEECIKATFVPETTSNKVTPICDLLVGLRINLVDSDWWFKKMK